MTNEISVITPQGRLDSAAGAGFEASVKEALAGGATGIVVDCESLDYISSAGLRVVLVASKQMKGRGGRLVVCALKPEVAGIFEISGLGSILEIVSSRADALQRLGA